MQDRISSLEFSGWLAYYSIEPWGEQAADLRHGILTSVIANANRDTKRKAEPFKPQDFMIGHVAPSQPPPFASLTGEGPEDKPRWMETKARMNALMKTSPRPLP